MDGLFEFDNADGGATHQSYDWFGSLSKLVYRLELLGAMVFLCWLVYCIPIAAEFLRRLSAFVSAPPFVFVFFNAVIIVIALSVKFGMSSAVNNVCAKENASTDEEEEEEGQLLREEVPARSESFFEGLNNDDVIVKDESFKEEEVAVLEDKEVILCEEKTTTSQTATIMTCDTYHHEFGIIDSDDQEEYEYGNESNPVDALSCEEFEKKIENFIKNMRTSLRMENNRTSIAVFD